MGVTLNYAKVLDRDELLRHGGSPSPGLDSVVRLPDQDRTPPTAAPFTVLRSWKDADGSFTETWSLRDRHGRTVHDPVTREVPAPHAQDGDPIDLADEVVDLPFHYADDGYQLILEVDGREVARVDFPVVETDQPPIS